LIDNQTSAAAGNFTERAVAAANARLAVPETFSDWQPETFK
jgi:hypothetical protein